MILRNKNEGRENKNRVRLQNLVDAAIVYEIPTGWEMKSFAVGGLSEVGFSKIHPELVLVISSQGRGIIDCSKFELIERDNDIDYLWFNSYECLSKGMGILKDEKIVIGGLCGGGLPLQNKYGDSLQYMATEWPIIDILFQPSFKSIYKENDGSKCFKIFHDYELRAYGFSYNGRYFITATGSEINIYRKKVL